MKTLIVIAILTIFEASAIGFDNGFCFKCSEGKSSAMQIRSSPEIDQSKPQLPHCKHDDLKSPCPNGKDTDNCKWARDEGMTGKLFRCT